ncbi:MAG: HAMP domain-containing histidine kinase [Armatimonadetes bacterium]|nr:HAMP domain-containing histidine kinase [Armatimonadota bacterium]
MLKTLSIKLSVILVVFTAATILLVSVLVNLALHREFSLYLRTVEQARNDRIFRTLTQAYKESGSWSRVGLPLNYFCNIMDACVKVTEPSGDTALEFCGTKARGGEVPKDHFMGPTTVSLDLRVEGHLVGKAFIHPMSHGGQLSRRDRSFLRTINTSILTAGVLAGLLLFVLCFFLSRRLTDPLSRMTQAAIRMGDGDLKQRVERNLPDDEMGQLGYAFNQMAERLENHELLRKTLTADVAHELRTPLTTLQSHIEAMQDGVIPADSQTLSSLHEEVMRLVKLVHDLQDLSRAESGKVVLDKSPADLSLVVRSSLGKLSPLLAEKGIEASVSGEAQPIPVDSGALSQILLNLIHNAMKYTPRGGRISVHLSSDSDLGILEVADTGNGIAEEDLPYIFERFYRADKSRSRLTGGTGIGLAIVKELVTAHSGTISVESKLGEGTRFILRFPRNS